MAPALVTLKASATVMITFYILLLASGTKAACPRCDARSSSSRLQKEDCLIGANYLRGLPAATMCFPDASGCSGMVHINSCATEICGPPEGQGILCSTAADYVTAAAFACTDSTGSLPDANMTVTEDPTLSIILTKPYASYAPGSVG
uniref:Putative extracellular protein TR9_098 n=1 Tax=Trebouxia lynnae TaxID=1825957 RepID=A0A7L9QEQ3_9CHLO|nr:putative extracellular protein TR9_098 [Trebouxia lynnae]